jgi:hypothetical protein
VVPAEQNSSFFERIGRNFVFRPPAAIPFRNLDKHVDLNRKSTDGASGIPTPAMPNSSCEVNVMSEEYLLMSSQSLSQIQQVELASFHSNLDGADSSRLSGRGLMYGGHVQRETDYRRMDNVYDEIYRAPISHSDNELMECYAPNIQSARNHWEHSEPDCRSFSLNPNAITAIKSTSGKNVGKVFEDKLDMAVSKDTKETKEETVSPAVSGPGSTAKETLDGSKATENCSKGNDTTSSSLSNNNCSRDVTGSNRDDSVADNNSSSDNLAGNN